MLRLFKPSPQKQAAEALFDTIVAQARRPELYADFDAPDTLDGRFDVLALHAYLVIARLKGEAEAEITAQHLFDALFKDMDDNLRELGVGDLTVPKKIKVMAEAFYGRVAAYDDALKAEGDEALAAALQKNVYANAEGVEDAAAAMAAYVRSQAVFLAAQPTARLLNGVVRFADIRAEKEAAL
ncbi:MAG: ubiquinol-cytochrome C chaperone family protein [Pseudomonadota bacterium]